MIIISSQKVILITGASAGIGKAIAQKLLEDGHIVYGAARREAKLKYLEEEEDGHYLIVDVTDEESRKQGVQQLLDREDRIDVLINNAGYGSYGAIEDVPISEAKRQFDVNLFGLARMIQLVLPKMRQQNSGTIINMSSMGGKIWLPLGGWYHASKFAVEGFSDCLRNEVRPFGIDVVLIEPGTIKSNWADIAADNLIETSSQGPYSEFAENQAESLRAKYSDDGMAVEPEVIAEVVLKAVQADNPKSRYAAPAHAKLFIFLNWLLPDKLFDKLVCKMIDFSK